MASSKQAKISTFWNSDL